MSDKERLIALLTSQKKFDENIQKKFGRDRAIVYSVYLLEKNDIEPTFQRICVVASKLFPESFSLIEFSEFPDSRIVRNCLWHCVHKSKGWLCGSDKTKYNLTEKGKEINAILFALIENNMDIKKLPLNIQKKLGNKELVTKAVDAEINFINEIKNSRAYLQFTTDRNEIKAIDIKRSLGGDRYSSNSYLMNNLIKAKNISKLINDVDIATYLNWLNDNWGKIMED